MYSNPLRIGQVLFGRKGRGFVHRRREGAAHRLQAGHRFLRSQPRAQGAAGRFHGMLNFAKEVYASVASPVWQFAPQTRQPRRRPLRGMKSSPRRNSEEPRLETFHLDAQRLQTMHAAGRVPRLSRCRGLHPVFARFAGLLDLHPPLPHQSFSRADGHRVIEFP